MNGADYPIEVFEEFVRRWLEVGEYAQTSLERDIDGVRTAIRDTILDVDVCCEQCGGGCTRQKNWEKS